MSLEEYAKLDAIYKKIVYIHFNKIWKYTHNPKS